MSLAILLRLVWKWNIQNVIYRNKRATKQNKTKKPTHDDQSTRQFTYIHIASLYVCASERNLTQYNWATIYWLNGWNSIFNQMTVIKLRIYDRSNNKFIFFLFCSLCLSVAYSVGCCSLHHRCKQRVYEFRIPNYNIFRVCCFSSFSSLSVFLFFPWRAAFFKDNLFLETRCIIFIYITIGSTV